MKDPLLNTFSIVRWEIDTTHYTTKLCVYIIQTVMGVDNGVLSTFCGKLQFVVCLGKINFHKNLITFNDNCKCVKQWGTCRTTRQDFTFFV